MECGNVQCGTQRDCPGFTWCRGACLALARVDMAFQIYVITDSRNLNYDI